MATQSYLAKKSWHVTNLDNQEKVWLAEEKVRAEEQKMKELLKQIKEEREIEEMQALTGIKPTPHKPLDWMYEGQLAVQQKQEEKEKEEYLLGKEVKSRGKDLDMRSISKWSESELWSKIPSDLRTVQQQPNPKLQLRTEQWANEMLDPLTQIRRMEQVAAAKKKEQALLANVRDKVTSHSSSKEREREREKEKHKHHKHKHHKHKREDGEKEDEGHKKSRRHRHDSDDDNGDDDDADNGKDRKDTTTNNNHNDNNRNNSSYAEATKAPEMPGPSGGTLLGIARDLERGTCYNCGEKGHVAKFCPRNGQAKFSAPVRTIGDSLKKN